MRRAALVLLLCAVVRADPEALLADKAVAKRLEREAGREAPPVVEERPSLRVLPAVEESERRPSSPPKAGERPDYLKVVK